MVYAIVHTGFSLFSINEFLLQYFERMFSHKIYKNKTC